MAAEAAADLHRQLSAPAAALRAAAAAVQREGQQAAAKQHQQSQQRQLQQPQPALLPALSVVNHATGQAIVINGMDKVRVKGWLLLPGAACAVSLPSSMPMQGACRHWTSSDLTSCLYTTCFCLLTPPLAS